MLNCALLGMWIGWFPWFPKYKSQRSRQAAGYKQEHINTKTIIESITIFLTQAAEHTKLKVGAHAAQIANKHTRLHPFSTTRVIRIWTLHMQW